MSALPGLAASFLVLALAVVDDDARELAEFRERKLGEVELEDDELDDELWRGGASREWRACAIGEPERGRGLSCE